MERVMAALAAEGFGVKRTVPSGSNAREQAALDEIAAAAIETAESIPPLLAYLESCVARGEALRTEAQAMNAALDTLKQARTGGSGGKQQQPQGGDGTSG